MKRTILPLLILPLLTLGAAHGQDQDAGAKLRNLLQQARSRLLPLTKVRDVRALGGPKADQLRRNVNLTGTVTFRDETREAFYLQDDTGGLIVDAPVGSTEKPEPGATVIIQGVTIGGMYGAGVRASALKITGAAPLPAPVVVNCRELAESRRYGLWVEVEATVLDYVVRSGLHVIELTSSGQYVVAVVHGAGAEPLRQSMVDARVKLRGVNWLHRDGALQVPGFAHLSILQPGYRGIFDVPAATAEALKNSPPDLEYRRHCRGVVRFVFNRASVFLSDGTTPFLLQLRPSLNRNGLPASAAADVPLFFLPEPGDEIDAAGTLCQTGRMLEMRSGCCRLIRKGQPLPPARPIGAEDMAAGRHQAEFVTVRGTLVKAEETATNPGMETSLTFDGGGVVYTAWLKSAQSSGLASLPLDHVVECSGFYVNFPAANAATRFLYLPSADSVRVIRPSSGIITRRIWQGVAAAAVLGVAAIAWIGVLRRQVRRRTASLAEANERLGRSEENLRLSLEQANELSALKSQFVSTVSHEFRTPLGVILSSADILSRYHDRLPDDQRREHLESISRNTQNLAGLMEEVLIHSRVEAGRMSFDPAPLDLAQLCRTLTNETLSATGGVCPIRFTSKVNDMPASGDAGLIRHIVINLLSNAVKYSAPGTPVAFSAARDGDHAVLTVCDHGIGIPPEDLPRVFNGFLRGSNVGQRQGTGLGLVIVKRCVDMHGGYMQLSGTPGGGTTVTVSLPLFSTEPSSTAA